MENSITFIHKEALRSECIADFAIVFHKISRKIIVFSFELPIFFHETRKQANRRNHLPGLRALKVKVILTITLSFHPSHKPVNAGPGRTIKASLQTYSFIGDLQLPDVTIPVKLHLLDTDDPVVGICFAKGTAVVDNEPFI